MKTEKDIKDELEYQKEYLKASKSKEETNKRFFYVKALKLVLES